MGSPGYAGGVPVLFGIQSGLLLIATLIFLAFKAWAFVDALTHRAEAYEAAGKLTKPAWMIITGLSLAAHMLLLNNPLTLLNLVGAVGSIVYIVDVRPALREVTGRR